MEDPREMIRKNAYWILSNISSGTPSQIELVINNPLFKNQIRKAHEDCIEVTPYFSLFNKLDPA